MALEQNAGKIKGLFLSNYQWMPTFDGCLPMHLVLVLHFRSL